MDITAILKRAKHDRDWFSIAAERARDALPDTIELLSAVSTALDANSEWNADSFGGHSYEEHAQSLIKAVEGLLPSFTHVTRIMNGEPR